MSIRVNLPDGSVANFPQGMAPEEMQAEIERYLASQQSQQPAAPERRVMTPGQNIARDVNRFRDTVGRGDQEFQENYDWQGEPSQQEPRQREIPLNAMEQQAQREAQRRGPPRRNAEISIREAIAQEQQGYQQPTMGATELNTPAMRDAMRGREAPTSEANTGRGPQRRQAEVSIREASDNFEENFEWSGGPNSTPPEPSPEKDPSEMTNAELRAAEIAAQSPVRELATDAAEAFTGAVRGGGQRVQEYTGRAASALGMTGVGARLLQGAEDTAALSERRRQEEAQREAAAASDAQRFAEERARREGAAQAPAPKEATAGQAPVAAQPAGALPSVQNPNAGQRTDVSMPRSLSIQGAREQGRGEQSMTFAMGDGGSVQVRKVPPAAMKSGTQSGLDFLMERADDIILKRLQAGDVAGATAFRDFVRGEQAQKGMTYMNRAVIAANYGDSDAFTSSLDRMIKAFDGDGDWQVDTKGTRLIQTDNGQAVGAMLSLRNKATGEVMEQEYMGMQNVIAALSDWGSPTAAYERQEERVATAVAQKIANAKSYQEAFDKAFEGMFDKDSFVDLDGNAISQGEMDRRVQMVNERIRAVRPDLVPQSAARPGAASGVGAITGGSSGQAVPTWGG